MKRILLLTLLISCQRTEDKIQNALRNEYGKDAVLVSYRAVGDNFNTRRIWGDSANKRHLYDRLSQSNLNYPEILVIHPPNRISGHQHTFRMEKF